MGLYKGTNQIKLYKGDYHPLALRVGNTQIAGYTTETARGTNAVELQNCYNEKLKAKVYGNSTQETSIQSANILDLTKLRIIHRNNNTSIEYISENEININLENSLSWDNVSLGPIQFKKSGAYNFSIKAKNDSSSNTDSYNNNSRIYGTAGILRYDKGTRENVLKYEMMLSNTDDTYNRDVNVDINLYDYYIIIYPNSRAVNNFGIFKYENMMLKEETGYTEYVPFVPNSPSLDYSSEIISTGDLVTEGEHKGKYKIILQNEGLSTSELQTTTIYLDAPLRAIEVSNTDNYNITKIIGGVTHYYIADYVDFARQKVVRNVGNVILNGTQSISYSSVINTDKYVAQFNIIILPYSKLISDKFKNVAGGWFVNNENISEGSLLGNRIQIKILQSRLATINQNGLNTWLAANPVTVVYILDTPIEEDIELEDINVIPNYCKVSVEVEQEPLALEVEYAKMIN